MIAPRVCKDENLVKGSSNGYPTQVFLSYLASYVVPSPAIHILPRPNKKS